MILTRTRIAHEIKKENIKIVPFFEDNLQTNSYDLTLENKLFVHKRCLCEHVPTGKKIEYIDSKNVEDDLTSIEIPTNGTILLPGKIYLGSTIETVQSKKFIAIVHPRHTISKLGINITVGNVHLGFNGKLIIRLTVIEPIKIYPDMKIAQLSFVKPTGSIKFLYKKQGSIY